MTEAFIAKLYDRTGKPRFTVSCAGYLEYEDSMVYIDLVTSSIQAFNAFCANLLKHKKTQTPVKTEIKLYNADFTKSQWLWVIPNNKYHQVVYKRHHILMDNRFDQMNFDFLFGGSKTEAPPHFATAIQRHVNVPFQSHWAEELWQLGVEESLIQPIPGVNATAWSMNKDGALWTDLVLEARKHGKLHVEGYEYSPEAALEANGITVFTQIQEVLDSLDNYYDPIPHTVTGIESFANGSSKFDLGRVYTMPLALEKMVEYKVDPSALLTRHQSGDWGEMSPEDLRANNQSINNGTRIFSSYPINDSEKVWIITNADRGATTLMLPEEY